MKRSDQMPIVIDDRELIALRALKERCGLQRQALQGIWLSDAAS